MKILIQTLYFSPELTGISKIVGEMANWLAHDRHDVRVVTVAPHYPQWRVHRGYSSWRYRTEAGAVTVYRCPVWIPRRPSGFTRLAYLASFALSSLPVMLAQVGWRPDVVMLIEPPLGCAPHALALGKLVGAETWLNIKDYELDAAISLGLLRLPTLESLARRVEVALMKRFDRVASISPAMVQRAIAKGVRPEAAVLFRDWVDLRNVHPDAAAAAQLRQEFMIPAERLVALYSGNLGEKQGVLLLADVARRLRHRRDLLFLVCGEGATKAQLEAAASLLPNFQLRPLVPASKLNALLNLADIHLLPQRIEAAELVMPSKLLYMLASGRPIVATARPDTEVGGTVAAVGGHLAEPGDGQAFADAISTFADQPDLRRRAGRAGREYAERNLDIEPLLRGFLQQCRGAARRA